MRFSLAAIAAVDERGLAVLGELGLPGRLTDPLASITGRSGFADVLHDVVRLLIDADRFGMPPVRCTVGPDLVGTFVMGFHELEASAAMLHQAYALACVLCHGPEHRSTINAAAIRALLARKPGNFYLRRACATLDIPVVDIGIPDRFQGGQGCFGRIFDGASTSADSHFGFEAQNDKFISNRLIRQAGFPGVEHEPAADENGARASARRLGFPLVVKPATGSNGVGASADIRSEQGLLEAFRAARATSPGRVLVERFVEGEEFRIFVAAGRHAGTRRKLKIGVVGDGRSTIRQLIEAENLARSRSPRNRDRIIPIDERTTGMLDRQGFGLLSVPAPGRDVPLASAFTTALGTSVDATDELHADNARMAEDIARLFRLPTIGIDFICRDIGTSWSAQPCAVIEVNASPVVRSREYAELYLRHIFGDPASAHIPSTLVIGGDRDLAASIWDDRARQGRIVGFSAETFCFTSRDDARRSFPTAHEAVNALLMNPRCEAVVVSRDVAEIREKGLPLARFSDCVIGRGVDVDADLLGLLDDCCGAGD